jgi:alkylation response protein AidB-like acyl-CoA dehydrogenase
VKPPGWREHLRGEFEPLRGVAAARATSYDAALAKRWEQELAAGGWIGIGWPARPTAAAACRWRSRSIFHEEYVRAGGPGRIGHIGETLLAPTLIAHGTAEQQQRFLPGIRAGTEYWAQGYSEPGAGSDLANVQTALRRDEPRRLGDQRAEGLDLLGTESDWIFVLARSDPRLAGPPGAGASCWCRCIKPGITIRPIRQMTGEAEFNEVFFDGARTEAAASGQAGRGLEGGDGAARLRARRVHAGPADALQHELGMVIAVARANGAARDPLLRQRIARRAGPAGLRYNALRMLASTTAAGRRPRRSADLQVRWSNWHRELGVLAPDVMAHRRRRGRPQRAIDDDRQRARRLLQVSGCLPAADTIYAGTNEIQLNLIAERALGMPR